MAGQYTYIKKVNIKTQDLALGMYVSELDKDWAESSFIFQGFPIQTEEELTKLREECDWVSVEFSSREDYQVYLKTINTEKRQQSHYQPIDKSTLNYELPKANQRFKSSKRMVKNVMQQIIKDEDFDITSVKQSVTECVDSILSNQDAMLLLSNIKNADEYTAEHCLRVSIMAIAFGSFLGLEKEELKRIGVGAMLHDVGKMRTPQAILNKPGKLSPAEYSIMKDHAIEGYNILKEKELIDPETIEIALSHHEKLNGEGYPNQLQEHQISYYTKVITIIDTYDAITSERIYSSAESPNNAFKILLDKSLQQFDQELAQHFIEWIGIYPVGSIVEMKTGELGIVIGVHPEQKLKPKVLLVTDENKKTDYQKMVDLGHMAIHSNGSPYQIKASHPSGYQNIKLGDYIDKGLISQN